MASLLTAAALVAGPSLLQGQTGQSTADLVTLRREVERCAVASAAGETALAAAAAAAAEEVGQGLLAGVEEAETRFHLARALVECRIPTAEFMARGALAAAAEEHLLRAIELAPELDAARLLLGVLLYHLPPFMGKTDQAAAVLADHVERRGVATEPQAWAYLGDLRERQGDAEAARAVWLTGLEHHPQHPLLLSRLQPDQDTSPEAPSPSTSQTPATGPAARAEGAASAELSAWLDAEVKRPIHVGMTVAVGRGGDLLHLAGHGWAELEHRVPAGPQTIYRIGSITKTFTAALVMLLAEEGALGLDDPLSRWLPEGPAPTPTLRHLLSHTAGLARDIPTYDAQSDSLQEQRDWVERGLAAPRLASPGERYSYSNLGYALLGRVIEEATGRTWAELLRERLLDPLRMTTTAPCAEEEILPHRAQGYQWQGDRFRHDEPLRTDPRLDAAGGLCSTAPDLLRWLTALRGDPPLSRRIWEQMTGSPEVTEGAGTTYALGLGVHQQDGRRVVQHGGAINGFFSEIAHFSAADQEPVDVVVLTNSETADPRALAREIADRVLAAR